MRDAFDEMLEALGRARGEREALQRRTSSAEMEQQRLSRDLERVKDMNARLVSRIAHLEAQTQKSDDRATKSRRAARDHAARTT